MKLTRNFLIAAFVLLLSSCDRTEPINDSQAISALERGLIYLEEMTNFEGTRECSLILCNAEYIIYFSLPTTMAPGDWMSFIMGKLKEKSPKYADSFTMVNKYHYEKTYLKPPENNYFKYHEKENRYEVKLYLDDD